ncbi:MAG: hypothetical protein TREMPRED_004634 [Tremellales sp. Tagirdzhanova-0007]|nr:MAG: hypothetical protein TREMPRED_004634 [Tremellales sp. Tagirdzhanova-0007]
MVQQRPSGSTAPKRERSASSSLSPPPTKAKPLKRVAPQSQTKVDPAVDAQPASLTKDDPTSSPPAKKPRIPKSRPWPPPDLAPELHPPRAGLPALQLPALSVAPNGSRPTSSPTLRPHLLGAHVSIGGGIGGALLRAGMAGANGLAMFVKSQRQWKSNPFETESVDRFRALMKDKVDGGVGYAADSILVHGSYLINLANPDEAKWETSYQCFKDDISRCHQLGVKLYNWHPGSTTGACSKEESYASVARAINRVHQDVPEVVCVIENMANAKSNVIGTTFHDLSSMISLVHDKSRVRICLDTCHLFAAGYDIRTAESYANVMRDFDREVGNGFLGGMHLNDSKADLGACKDLHENIGLGKIGLSAFRAIMRDPLVSGIPLILETPAPEKALEFSDLAIWAREIKLLYEIQAISDADWVRTEGEIEKRWRVERDLLNPPKPPKTPKEKKPKVEKKGKKGEKGKLSDDEGEVDEHTYYTIFSPQGYGKDLLPAGVERATMIIGETTRGQMVIGGLGSCFLLLAMISLSLFPMFKKHLAYAPLVQEKLVRALLVPLAIADDGLAAWDWPTYFSFVIRSSALRDFFGESEYSRPIEHAAQRPKCVSIGVGGFFHRDAEDRYEKDEQQSERGT